MEREEIVVAGRWRLWGAVFGERGGGGSGFGERGGGGSGMVELGEWERGEGAPVWFRKW